MRGEEKLSPPPPSSFLFFSLSSQLPRRIRAEMLAMQATKVAEFYRCLYAEGGGGGGKFEPPPNKCRKNFVAFGVVSLLILMHYFQTLSPLKFPTVVLRSSFQQCQWIFAQWS